MEKHRKALVTLAGELHAEAYAISKPRRHKKYIQCATDYTPCAIGLAAVRMDHTEMGLLQICHELSLVQCSCHSMSETDILNRL